MEDKAERNVIDRKMEKRISFHYLLQFFLFIRLIIFVIYDFIRIVFFRWLFGPKLPGWNFTFELIATLVQRIMYSFVIDIDNVPYIRLFLDTDSSPPITRPKDIVMKAGEHVGNIKSMPNYEWFYSSNQTYPEIDSNDKLPSNRKYLLYLHGGGFFFGNISSYRGYMIELAKATNTTILLINYRRSPEYAYPIPDLDCYEVYKWMIERVSPSNLFVAGDSAGIVLYH